MHGNFLIVVVWQCVCASSRWCLFFVVVMNPLKEGEKNLQDNTKVGLQWIDFAAFRVKGGSDVCVCFTENNTQNPLNLITSRNVFLFVSSWRKNEEAKRRPQRVFLIIIVVMNFFLDFDPFFLTQTFSLLQFSLTSSCQVSFPQPVIFSIKCFQYLIANL